MSENEDENKYKDWLTNNFSEMIAALDLDDRQKLIIKNRWLDQVSWMENKSTRSRNRYNWLRLIAIIGGVIVPALIGLNLDGNISEVVSWVVLVISLSVAITSAIEEFFKYGEKYLHYRKTVEILKSEGWLYFQLSGKYNRYKTHTDAFKKFTGHVEEILQADVKEYIDKVSEDQTDEGDEEEVS